MSETPSSEELQEASALSEQPTAHHDSGIQARIATRLIHWKRRLLDLSKRNRLLNFKVTPVSTIAIVEEEPAEIFRRLWIKDGTMRFKASRSRDSKAIAHEDSADRQPW